MFFSIHRNWGRQTNKLWIPLWLRRSIFTPGDYTSREREVPGSRMREWDFQSHNTKKLRQIDSWLSFTQKSHLHFRSVCLRSVWPLICSVTVHCDYGERERERYIIHNNTVQRSQWERNTETHYSHSVLVEMWTAPVILENSI